MSSPLVFVRDGRTLPFVPVTAAALVAITQHVPTRRLAYARSLYVALLELANEGRGERVAVTRKALGERSGCSRDLVSDLRPLLEQAGVVRIHERAHAGQVLEHEWEVIEPAAPSDGGAVERTPVADSHDPHGYEPRLSLEEKKTPTEKESAQARAKQPIPEDFPSELRPHLERAFVVLREVAREAPHGREVVPMALARTMMARPRKPLVRSAHDYAAWAAGKGYPHRDVVAGYRNWLDSPLTPTLAATEVLPEDEPTSRPASVPGDARSERKAGRDWRTRQRLQVMAGGAPAG